MGHSMRSSICIAFVLLLGAACGGGGGTGTGGGSPTNQPLTLNSVRTAADSYWGVVQLSLPYQVATTGILVVSVSWYEAMPANNPTFNGANLNLVAHGQTTIARLRIAHGAMYYLPVTTGQSGNIQITFPGYANRVSMTAVTIAGATAMVGAQTALANVSPSPLGLDIGLGLTAQSMVITLLSSSAAIDSIVTGTGHVENSNPTQPLTDFHDARSYTGHAMLGPGNHTVGYAQDPGGSAPPSPQWLYDAVMVAGSFR